MAGDWIKMRVDLGDDPAVVLIASIIGATEDEVVGKLHRLWSWADRHTTDGTAPAITSKWVDRYVGSPGFASAMEQAQWIFFSDAGVVFPSFDKHNGESAKRRGEAALRQRLSRKNRDSGHVGEERTPLPRPFVRHVMNRDNFTCVYCGQQSDSATEASRKAILGVDHIKPISRGGSAAVENLACCCKACNNEKNDRTPEEWDLLPTFLQPGVHYVNGALVTDKSHEKRDASVTREEKRREEKKEDKQGAVALVTADALIADGLPSDLANELLQSRKRHRAPLTPRAWDGIKREARTAGLSPAQAVQKMIERGWRGFEAGWLSDGGQKAAPRPIEQRTYTPEELGL